MAKRRKRNSLFATTPKITFANARARARVKAKARATPRTKAVSTKGLRFPVAKPKTTKTNGNVGNTYNNVAQGADNKTVQVAAEAATLADIDAHTCSVTVESDDPSPIERLRMNTPDEVFTQAFNAEEDDDDLECPFDMVD